MVALGGVLSTRRFAITVELAELPATSVATARRSYRPSETAVVSKLTEYGALRSVPIAVQVPAPAGERWKTTCATPLPPVSAADAVSVTPARRFAPGSFCVAVGFVLSIERFEIAAELEALPTLSVATMRKS